MPSASRHCAASLASSPKKPSPSTRLSPLLFDLTSLQREANGRFGFSAKTTLGLAQALYEKHKVLTYPRTDSRCLPEDYLATVKETLAMLTGEGAGKGHDEVAARPLFAVRPPDHGAQLGDPEQAHLQQRQDQRPLRHHPDPQAPKHLSEMEQKLYDFVVRRFLSVFYPAAEYLVTTRITRVEGYPFKTEGKVLVNPGWLAVHGKEGQEGTEGNLVAVAKAKRSYEEVTVKANETKPPARYSEATLLSAMEGAGKMVDDEELKAAMAGRGLGTPATRAQIIENLIGEQYMHREGRELTPTAKAFSLMTLLNGLGYSTN
jgi:DNA topoisomerase III